MTKKKLSKRLSRLRNEIYCLELNINPNTRKPYTFRPKTPMEKAEWIVERIQFLHDQGILF